MAGRIKSPTYTVMEPYRVGAFEISHFDFYRFDDPREFEDAGFRDVFSRPGLKLVEWPDRAAGVLPLPDLQLELDVDTHEQREVTAQALTPRGAALLAGV